MSDSRCAAPPRLQHFASALTVVSAGHVYDQLLRYDCNRNAPIEADARQIWDPITPILAGFDEFLAVRTRRGSAASEFSSSTPLVQFASPTGSLQSTSV